MKKAFFCGVLITLVQVGCGKNDTAKPDAKVEIIQKIIKEHSEDLDLAKLIDKSREELAAECVEYETKIHRQEGLRQQGELDLRLLPDARFPLMPPVLREASYRPSLGISLPPYLKDSQKDAAVALHLARHGDTEAALKLTDPKDTATLEQIERLKLDRNYPIEWTRFVGLMQHHLEFTLASDIPEAGRQLMALHCQLRDVLSEKAKEGPLGQALLTRGFDTLKRCGPKVSDAALPKQIDDFFNITTVAESPEWKLPQSGLERLLGTKSEGPALVAASPIRALDLLGLDVPHENADLCAVFPRNAAGKTELLLTYRSGLKAFARPEQFTPWIELRHAGKAEDLSAECLRRVYSLKDGQLEVMLTPRNDSNGAIVRFTNAKDVAAPKTPAPLPRDLGTVNLDRSYEANRRLFAWKEQGKTVSVRDPKRSGLHDPLTSRALLQATIERHGAYDLLDHLRLDYADAHSNERFGLGETSAPMLERFGAPQLQLGTPGQIDLTWDDGATSYGLRFANERTKAVTLQVRDVRNLPIEERVQAAQKFDASERKVRIVGDKALSVVPRELDHMQLGMSRADFVKALPRAPDMMQRDIAGGVMASFTGVPRGTGEVLAREWFARFDPQDHLVELRIRYTDFPGAPPGTGLKKKVDALKTSLGKPLSSSLSSKKSSGLVYSWQDDNTTLQCLQEGGGVEMILRDCPLEHANGYPLAKLEFLPIGVGPIKLGTTLEALQKFNPKQHEDGLLIESRTKDTYDIYLVWLKDNRVVRIAARHNTATPMKTTADGLKNLGEAWSRVKDQVGYPRTFLTDPVTRQVNSWGTCDDVTRFRVHVEDDGRGVQLFTEWTRNETADNPVQVTERN